MELKTEDAYKDLERGYTASMKLPTSATRPMPKPY